MEMEKTSRKITEKTRKNIPNRNQCKMIDHCPKTLTKLALMIDHRMRMIIRMIS